MTMQPTRNIPASTLQASSLRIKSITVGGLHKAAELLGGEQCRTTGGHNYLVYRFANGKQVHLPPIKGNGNGTIGRGDLQSILRKMLEAGIPQIVLEQALDEMGATWRSPPPTLKRIRDLLILQPDIARTGRWGQLEALHQQDITPLAAPVLEQPKAPAPEKGITLWDAITRHLPRNRDNSIVQNVMRGIKEQLTTDEQPYTSLFADGHINAEPRGDSFKYTLNEYAANEMAKLAKPIYEKQFADSKLPKPPRGQKWSGLTLREVILLDLPTGVPDTQVQFLHSQLSNRLETRTQPYSRLNKEKHVIRNARPNKHNPQQLLISEHAASVLAREARSLHDATFVTPEPAAAPATDLVELSLRDVIISALPKSTDPRLVSSLTRSFARKYTKGHEPFATLIENNNIAREGNYVNGYTYKFNEDAVDAVAQAAKDQLLANQPAASIRKTAATTTPARERRPDLTLVTLGEVVRKLLPADAEPTVITQLASQAGIGINHSKDPYAELITSGHLLRYRAPGADRYSYEVTPHAVEVISTTALNTYRSRYEPIPEFPTLDELSTGVQQVPVPSTPSGTPVQPAAAKDTSMAKSKAKQKRVSAPVNLQPLSISDAINTLTRRFDIYPTFQRPDLQLNLHDFVISISKKPLSISDAVNELTRQYDIRQTVEGPELRLNLKDFLTNVEVATRSGQTNKPITEKLDPEEEFPPEEELPF